jgi:hypothetical protein
VPRACDRVGARHRARVIEKIGRDASMTYVRTRVDSAGDYSVRAGAKSIDWLTARASVDRSLGSIGSTGRPGGGWPIRGLLCSGSLSSCCLPLPVAHAEAPVRSSQSRGAVSLLPPRQPLQQASVTATLMCTHCNTRMPSSDFCVLRSHLMADRDAFSLEEGATHHRDRSINSAVEPNA